MTADGFLRASARSTIKKARETFSGTRNQTDDMEKQDGPAAMSAQEINETLNDGLDVAVRTRDGRDLAVKVRKVPRSEFAHYSLMLEDLSAEGEIFEAAFYCGQPPEWALCLDEESFDRVLAEGQRLNFSTYARWFRRSARLVPLVSKNEELIKLALEQAKRLEQRSSTNGSSARDTASASSAAGRSIN
jgi:hypothetical protein